jgi:hypothetical protein
VTGAQTIAAFRRALTPALIAAGVTLMVVVGLMMSRPPTYEVKVGLIATPTAERSGSAMDFGQFVSLAMPSLPEFVVADDVVTAIRDQVPHAPSEDALRSAIKVELVPASGVARISVTTANPDTSQKVLGVVIDQVQRANLLSPVATLKPIGTSRPAATVVGRDPLLALGLGLVAAIAVSLLTVVVVQTLRPRLLTCPDVERIVDGVFEGEAPPPVVEVGAEGQGVDLLAAYLLAQDPGVIDVKVVATGPTLPGDFARQLRNSLRKVKAAREAGMAIDPLGEIDPFVPGRPAAARHRTHQATIGHEFGSTAQGSTAQGSTAQGSTAQGSTVKGNTDVPDGAREASTSGGSTSGGSTEPGGSGTESTSVPGTSRLSTVLRGRASDETFPLPLSPTTPLRAAETIEDAAANDPTNTHLVLTVRLRRTTPVALTTALITLRTHGTGVAGVAVS